MKQVKTTSILQRSRLNFREAKTFAHRYLLFLVRQEFKPTDSSIKHRIFIFHHYCYENQIYCDLCTEIL